MPVQRKARSGFARWLVRIAVALACLALTPLLLTLAYRVVPPVSTRMLYHWATGQPVDRRWTSIEDISPALLRAVITSEDSRFCVHRGVDWNAIGDALEEDRNAPRGASTIAMQTVKNLFLWPSRDYVRKALEVPLALYADFVLGKRRILEIYLNVAQWGPGLFGVEAASRRAFGEPAAGLTPGQSALLAVTLPNPILRDPRRPSPGMVRLAAGLAERGPVDVNCLAPRGGKS